ncbi:MAG: VTT domain-containing protein [Bacteroidota bacterium]
MSTLKLKSRLQKTVGIAKRVIYLLWIFIIVGIVGYFVLHPDSFSAEKIATFIESFEAELFLTFALLSLIRGIFLLPFTPFAVGGAMLFPDQLLAVFIVTMISILLSSTAIYYFSNFLGFSEKLEQKYAKQFNRWKERLSQPKAIVYIFLCSVAPIFSTELACYIAGVVKMPFRNVLLGVLVGSLLLCSFYVYFGSVLMTVDG